MVQDQANTFHPEQRVRVVEGLFAGREGRVIGPAEARQLGLEDLPPFVQAQACWVMISLLGELTPVCFLPGQLSAIEAPNTQAG